MLIVFLVSVGLEQSAEGPGSFEVLAASAAEPIEVDGRLEEPVWDRAVAYTLTPSRDRIERGVTVQEPGTVPLAYDENYLYAAFRFADSDVVQENEEDQKSHFVAGDVAELFIKPVEETWYWELYVTPNGFCSAFFFPGRGRYARPACTTTSQSW